MGLLPWYARVPVGGATPDIDLFVRSGWVGVGSDRNAGPTIMMAQDIGNADILEATVSGRRVCVDGPLGARGWEKEFGCGAVAVVCPACMARPAAAGPDGFRDPL